MRRRPGSLVEPTGETLMVGSQIRTPRRPRRAPATAAAVWSRSARALTARLLGWSPVSWRRSVSSAWYAARRASFHAVWHSSHRTRSWSLRAAPHSVHVAPNRALRIAGPAFLRFVGRRLARRIGASPRVGWGRGTRRRGESSRAAPRALRRASSQPAPRDLARTPHASVARQIWQASVGSIRHVPSGASTKSARRKLWEHSSW